MTVSADGTTTEHRVSVSRDELGSLAPAADDPTELVASSFGYLLEREPKESILTRFELSDIERYFPTYRTDIRRRLG